MARNTHNFADGGGAPAHGGNLAEAAALVADPSAPWVDLSTGINPFAYPVPEISERSWTALPQGDALGRLLAAARAAYGVAPAAGVVAAPGTQALIQILPSIVEPGRRVAIVIPTYAEHAAAWTDWGHEVVPVADPADADASEADVLVVVNPNNPDGRTWAGPDLVSATEAMRQRGGLLVIDEAFMDLTPDRSAAALADTPGVAILRSFGKFYGLAGVRLGFLLGNAALAAAVARRMGPWAVSGPALAVGETALDDRQWAVAARETVAGARRRLDRILEGAGIAVVGGTDLYRLVDVPSAADLHIRLARHGLWTRRFDDQPNWLRFGLCPDGEAEERLRRALGDGAM
ncbi:threonine-phosphate decarboxylase CobD [Fodinicurvata sp. EGI_FJ10296]|uniref:threonine-phosphate decarboxylase CobD n=1 Tax=Fodinicurvata sp. EGI_FJ10296 TaxID=3231908 RepID=UPI0034552712